jgi:hypothetical protein
MSDGYPTSPIDNGDSPGTSKGYFVLQGLFITSFFATKADTNKQKLLTFLAM